MIKMTTKLINARNQIIEEYNRAINKYQPFNSAHEGFAILLEELEELWDAIKLKQSNPHRNKEMHTEAIQVGAMTLRFLIDCCGDYLDE